MVAVSEDEMVAAINRLYAGEQVVAEPAGAAATAALLTHHGARVLTDPAKTISVALVTGGNIAPELRQKIGLT